MTYISLFNPFRVFLCIPWEKYISVSLVYIRGQIVIVIVKSLCLYFPLVSDATALPQGVVSSYSVKSHRHRYRHR